MEAMCNDYYISILLSIIIIQLYNRILKII